MFHYVDVKTAVLPARTIAVGVAFHTYIHKYLSKNVVRNLESVLNRGVRGDDLQKLVVVHHDQRVHRLLQFRNRLESQEKITLSKTSCLLLVACVSVCVCVVIPFC